MTLQLKFLLRYNQNFVITVVVIIGVHCKTGRWEEKEWNLSPHLPALNVNIPIDHEKKTFQDVQGVSYTHRRRTLINQLIQGRPLTAALGVKQ